MTATGWSDRCERRRRCWPSRSTPATRACTTRRPLRKLGLAGAPIEGPTHFSQIDPLAVERWGQAWFERGCVSSHFLNMVVEGEQVRAALEPVAPTLARIAPRRPTAHRYSPGRRRSGATTRPSSTSVGGGPRRPGQAVHRRPAGAGHDACAVERAGHDGFRRPQRKPLSVHAGPEARQDHGAVVVVRRRRRQPVGPAYRAHGDDQRHRPPVERPSSRCVARRSGSSSTSRSASSMARCSSDSPTWSSTRSWESARASASSRTGPNRR